MKKIMAMFLLLTMLLSVLAVPAFATGDAVFSVVTDHGPVVEVGEENIVVTVQIANNPTYGAIDMTIGYPEGLTVTAFEGLYSSDGDTGVLTDNADPTHLVANRQIKISDANARGVKKNGDFITITFSVDAEAKGDLEITLEIDAFVDKAETPLDYKVENLTFKVAGGDALTFQDGTTTYDFATLKADKYELTAPGAGYYFAGWFSGLVEDEDGMITIDEDGRYILSDAVTPDGSSFAAVECRPKYDEAPESGTYNALWVCEDSATFSAMVLEVYADSFTYSKTTYEDQTNEVTKNNDALRSAWDHTAGNGRVKLVKDMTVAYFAYYGTEGTLAMKVPLKLDMNGRTLTGVKHPTVYVYRGEAVVCFWAGTTGNALESSHGQGKVKQTYFGESYGDAIVAEAVDVDGTVIRDVDILGEDNTISKGVTGLRIGKSHDVILENVNIKVNTTHASADLANTYAISSSNVDTKGTQIARMDNCTVSSNGYLIWADRTNADFGIITNSVLTATGTTVAPIKFVGGNIGFGAGNTVTSASSGLFDGAPIVAFTTEGSTFRCAEGGNPLGENVQVSQSPVPGTIAANDNGTLVFVGGFTVKFLNHDGTKVLWSDRYQNGETPVDHTVSYDIVGITTYEHLGWSTTLGSTNLVDPTTLSADTTLYAVRKEVILPAAVSISVNGGEAVQYATWDMAVATLNYAYLNQNVLLKLEKDTEGSAAFGLYANYTLDLNGHTFTYTNKSNALYAPAYNRYTSSFTLTSSAEEKGTLILAEGAKGVIFANAWYGATAPLAISNVRIEASYLSANTTYNASGAVITVINDRDSATESLTMTDVEIVAATCPAVEFSIGKSNATCKINATFTNVKLSGSPVAVAAKSNGNVGAGHITLAVDTTSAFMGADGIYPIQENNGAVGLTPVYPEGYVLTEGNDGWYTFAPAHVHDFSLREPSDVFLATPGNCGTKASYYYSCACGEKDTTETFETDYVHAELDDKGLCKDCGNAPKTELETYSISLNGNIGVNFYVNVAEADKDNTKVKITVGEITTELPISDEMLTDGQYKVSVDVAARQMTDEICVEVLVGDTVKDSGKTSVKAYAMGLLGETAPENYTDLQKLAVAMLNYGAWAQKHFGYNTANLANAELNEADRNAISSVTADTLSTFAFQGNDGEAKLTSASLILKSETTLRLFFTVDGEMNVVYNNETLSTDTRGGYSYVDITNIDAKSLSNDVTVTANGSDVTCNPMAYGYAVLKADDNSILCDLVRALYLYNQAAVAYFPN